MNTDIKNVLNRVEQLKKKISVLGLLLIAQSTAFAVCNSSENINLQPINDTGHNIPITGLALSSYFTSYEYVGWCVSSGNCVYSPISSGASDTVVPTVRKNFLTDLKPNLTNSVPTSEAPYLYFNSSYYAIGGLETIKISPLVSIFYGAQTNGYSNSTHEGGFSYWGSYSSTPNTAIQPWSPSGLIPLDQTLPSVCYGSGATTQLYITPTVCANQVDPTHYLSCIADDPQ